jgi:hypothetical protein
MSKASIPVELQAILEDLSIKESDGQTRLALNSVEHEDDGVRIVHRRGVLVREHESKPEEERVEPKENVLAVVRIREEHAADVQGEQDPHVLMQTVNIETLLCRMKQMF